MAGSKIGIGLGRRFATTGKVRAVMQAERPIERAEPPLPRPLSARELIAMARSARKAVSDA